MNEQSSFAQEPSDYMLEPFASKFSTPTKASRRLSILLTIYNSPSVSQHQIGKLTGLSSAMVNNYVKELQRSGHLLVSGETNRSQQYHLTASGKKELHRLLSNYWDAIKKMHGSARDELLKIKKITDSLASGETADIEER